MTDAERAERAADFADRLVRWGVALILGVMLVIAFQIATLAGRVDALTTAQAETAAQVRDIAQTQAELQATQAALQADVLRTAQAVLALAQQD